MTCPVPAPLTMLAVGRGGWSFALAFVDAGGNPVNLTTAGLTPVASFFQGNTGTTTALTVEIVDAPNGLATAVVPEAVVLSTLYPAPSARLLGGLPGLAPSPTYRLYAYVLDALGNRASEQVLAVRPVDWRTADPGTLPQPPLLYLTVGPSGPQGAQGIQGVQGIPGGMVPFTEAAVASIAAYQVVRAVSGGVQPANSADPTQAGTVLGIATVAAATGQNTSFVDGGPIMNASWSWTPGPIFFDNFGQLKQARPTSGFAQSVGRALDAHTIAVELGDAEVIEP